MQSNRVRSILGLKGNYQQYHDLNDVSDLSEISDPETLEDETKTGIRDWAADHKILFVASSLLTLVASVLMLALAWRLVPDIVGNRLVQATAVAIVIFGAGYRYGWSGNQNRIVEIDRLVLTINGNTVAYWGTYIEGGNYPLFIAVKGFHRGRKPVPYTIRDVDASIVNRRDQIGVSLDDPAVIRLNETFAGVTETDTGTVVAQESGGLQIDHPGRESTLSATLPEHADPALIEEIKDELETKEEELADERENAKRYKRQRNEAWEDAMKPLDERMDKTIEWYERIETARSPRQRDRSTMGPRPDLDSDPSTNGKQSDSHQRIHNQVTDDE